MRGSAQISKQLDALRDLYVCGDMNLALFKDELLKNLLNGVPLDEIEVSEVQVAVEEDLKHNVALNSLPAAREMAGECFSGL